MKVSGGGCTDYLHGIYILQASRNYLSCFHSVVVAGALASRCYSLCCSWAQHLYGNSHLIACLCVCTTSFGLSANKRVVWLLFYLPTQCSVFHLLFPFTTLSLSLSFTWRDLLRPPGRKLGQSTKKTLLSFITWQEFCDFFFFPPLTVLLLSIKPSNEIHKSREVCKVFRSSTKPLKWVHQLLFTKTEEKENEGKKPTSILHIESPQILNHTLCIISYYNY